MANGEIYSYGGSIIEPEYSEFWVGYRLAPARIGAPTSPQTANQIAEVSARLSEGMKTVEISALSPEVFETVPKQHLEEIHRLGKLVGAETSVHGPMIDPAGFTREGWSEFERQNAERRMLEVVKRSHDLNPKGNVPVTFHASALPGTEWAAGLDVEKQIEEINKERAKEGLPPLPTVSREEAFMVAVNQETGSMIPLKIEERYYPETGKKEIVIPRKELEMINNGEWSSKMVRLLEYKKIADELREEALPQVRMYEQKIASGLPLTEAEKSVYEAAKAKLLSSKRFVDSMMAAMRSDYSEAYKYSSEKERELLEEASKPYREFIRGAEKYPSFSGYIEKEAEVVDKLLEGMQRVRPEIYVPVENFALEKASKTFGDVAFKAYEKFGESAPIICVENLYPGMAFSRAEQLKQLIEKSREKFVEAAVKAGKSRQEAREAAEKLIGATWDVGHINMLRKGGFRKEEIIAETKKIAPYVKHVHLSDNFGFADTHLPPGMGEVPTKEMLKELEKAGFFGKSIVEAGAFVQQFKTSPHKFALEALGAPVYAPVTQPSWTQAGALYGAAGYFAGYGTFLPEQHFAMYGTSLTGIPVELGGQMPGKRTGLAGTPME